MEKFERLKHQRHAFDDGEGRSMRLGHRSLYYESLEIWALQIVSLGSIEELAILRSLVVSFRFRNSYSAFIDHTISVGRGLNFKELQLLCRARIRVHAPDLLDILSGAYVTRVMLSMTLQSNPLNGSALGPVKYWTNKRIEPLTNTFYYVSTKMGLAKAWINYHNPVIH